MCASTITRSDMAANKAIPFILCSLFFLLLFFFLKINRRPKKKKNKGNGKPIRFSRNVSSEKPDQMAEAKLDNVVAWH